MGEPIAESRVVGEPIAESRAVGEPIVESRVVGEPLKQVGKYLLCTTQFLFCGWIAGELRVIR